ncbi:anaerobic ribonucleoside-triphosphate reductase activating protein [Sneathia vaginalis]|jgi:hypothetical protein|uniref:anaerobic ribonucleoside-triphosphate reductase activating protein n=1 Tax=Sneathia TaxID=168808 RepID=UPI00186726FB|nr:MULTISPECIES: anaerobic ribonucleoside-triphosphate reductase activating protein [Sneathia]MBE2989494.1 anaerobic ribonucleoside-triphosphate reductase activating protein [Sneathia sp. DSM 16630]MBE3031262.1 anaerobic ribonucleoside-triphosphate reductase activating protein [Sneathia sp. DSM 16631]MDK9582293.1 anaerobic ribonucleoside-triphosphate reductase activating protein [Sneathia vaginalis]
MNYALIKEMDVADGPGIRTSLFVSGCKHKCKGCFNEDIWEFDTGKEFTYDTIEYIVKLLKRDYIKGLTLLGGEPLDPDNQEWVYKLVVRVREEVPNKTIWCYTGYTYEFVIGYMYKKLPYTKKLLDLVDVLVDGKFIQDLLDLKLQFRGSANQRVIDLRKTEKEHKIIWALGKEEEAKYRKRKQTNNI